MLQHILRTMGNDVEAGGYRLCCCSVLDSTPHDDNDCALNSQVEEGQLLGPVAETGLACAGLVSSPQMPDGARRLASAAGAQRRRRTGVQRARRLRAHRPATPHA